MKGSPCLTVDSVTALIPTMNDTIDINALSQETGISVRTIRYYLAQNLLPPPSGRGSAAAYGPGHRDRLRLIRRLQDAHLPLAEIRKQLLALDDAGVARALVTPATTTTPPAVSAAYEYVRQVLAKAKAPAGIQDGTAGTPDAGASVYATGASSLSASLATSGAASLSAHGAGPSIAPAAAAAVNHKLALGQDKAGSQVPATQAAPANSSAPNTATGPRKPLRSNWERITLHPDIELHVRRPLARSDQRRLDELLELAMRLFEDQG